MQVVCFPENHVPRELRIEMLGLQRQAWPSDEPLEVRTVHDPRLKPLSMLLIDDGRVCSSLDVLSKAITFAGQEWAASGLSMVVTDAELRGRGYGRHLVEAAREQIAGSGADVGLFTCDAPLRGFHADAGWDPLPGTVLVGGTEAEPFPSDQFDKVTFGGFFTAASRQARHAFVGSRVPLYSGTIDKLW